MLYLYLYLSIYLYTYIYSHYIVCIFTFTFGVCAKNFLLISVCRNHCLVKWISESHHTPVIFCTLRWPVTNTCIRRFHLAFLNMDRCTMSFCRNAPWTWKRQGCSQRSWQGKKKAVSGPAGGFRTPWEQWRSLCLSHLLSAFPSLYLCTGGSLSLECSLHCQNRPVWTGRRMPLDSGWLGFWTTLHHFTSYTTLGKLVDGSELRSLSEKQRL